MNGRWSPRAAVSFDGAAVAALVVLTLLMARVTVAQDDPLPFGMLAPLILGVVLLSDRMLSWFVGFVLLTVLVLGGYAAVDGFEGRVLAALGIDAVLCLVVLWFSVQRQPISHAGRRGESMLVDLRDRILAQGQIPALPGGWLVESSLSSAGGSPYAGDFVVATVRDHGRLFEVAVVDVSGKGEAAGTRALQLSGAMGGLIGALPPGEFLEASNEYLLQRDWEEGFATAVHLSLELGSGGFEVRSAGHPPPALRRAGSGRWEVLRTEGPVLGLLDGATYDVVAGRLLSGDTLLLYTDGMVERPRRDIDLGLDAMLGAVESLASRSWEGMAARITRSVGSADDDRALLVVHRR